MHIIKQLSVIMKMMKSSVIKLIGLLLILLSTTHCSHVRLHLNHPIHSMEVRRHQLASHRNLIRHDMRIFQSHSSHLSHDSVAENYQVNDMGYFFTLNLTIAGLPYRLNIDTGSSDLFIKGEQSPGKPANKYSCPSCQKNSPRISIGYLDGSLDTYKSYLPVELGNHHFNESILVAYTAPKNFEQSEGLVGLSFPELARNRDPTFIQTLIDNKIIGKYAFGVNLNFQQHHRSFISFGVPDRDLFEGQLKKYRINSGYSYTINAKGVSFGDGPVLSTSTALLDTGNTCISIPRQYESSILQKFNNGINSCGFDKEEFAPQFSLLRCKIRDHQKLPILHVHIENEIYDIDHNAYTQRCVKKGDVDFCDLLFESVSQHELFLGDGFFNRFYAYFNIVDREIGFAKNKQILSYKYMYINQSELDEEDRDFFSKLK